MTHENGAPDTRFRYTSPPEHWHLRDRNETRMPPRVVIHCGRHMRFLLAPLLYACPMCGECVTVDSLDVGE